VFGMTTFETHWLDVPLGRIRVRTAGTGPALMFTHGLLVDSRIWDQVAGAVASQGFTVVLPDLPLGAHAIAVADRSKLTTSAVASSLFDIADRLDVQRFSILGFDTGGAIAQVATASQPERIDRPALMSCDAFHNYPPPLIKPFKWAARWSPAMSLILKTLSSNRYQHIPMPLGLVAKHKIDETLVKAWVVPSATIPEVRADVVAFIRQMNAVDTLAAADQLRHFTGPSMVMWSRQEKVFPRKDAHRLVELIPECQLRWIDDAYTFASLDNPTRMIELILEFLNLPKLTRSVDRA
jgi:pimeloyl-ACP methyl ester carboxylesterase